TLPVFSVVPVVDCLFLVIKNASVSETSLLCLCRAPLCLKCECTCADVGSSPSPRECQNGECENGNGMTLDEPCNTAEEQVKSNEECNRAGESTSNADGKVHTSQRTEATKSSR
ncbi:hypothetical protein HN51_024953, partial [Arachis hypogaea]